MKNPVTTTEILKLVEQLKGAGFCVVVSTSGEVYTVSPSLNGKGRQVQPYDRNAAIERAKWALRMANKKFTMQQLGEAVGHLKLTAEGSAKTEVYVRIGEKDGCIYLDRCDDSGSVIEIGESGWRVLPTSPVLFVRPQTSLPLPEPKKASPGEGLERLRRILGLADHGNWLLFCGCLFGAMRPSGAHLMLVLSGPPGAGKTTMTDLFARCVDPRSPQHLQITYNSEDLQLAASKRWILVLDELDGLTLNKSQTLAALVTGSGIEVRRKFTDTQTTTIVSRSPIAINGLGENLKERRILDRSVPVTLTRPADGCRRAISDIEREFVAAWPEILGALCDGASAALRYTGEACDPQDQLRMTEAGVWVEKCLQSMGAGRGEFSRLVKAAQNAAQESLAGDWLPLPAIEALAKKGFKGTANELYAQVNARSPDYRHQQGWPKSANLLSAELAANAAALEQLGIVWERSRTSKERTISLSVPKSATAAIRSPEPLPPERFATRTSIGDALAPVMSDRPVVFMEWDGTYTVVGPWATQVNALLNRPADDSRLVRLSEAEWESVSEAVSPEPMLLVPPRN